MSYKEKMAKVRAFGSSLSKLLQVAYEVPKLSLNQRRAVVASIFLGGKNGCSTRDNSLVPALAQKSHEFTKNGLTKALSEKLNTSNPDLPDTIMKISSLSAWVHANPNQCEDMMDFFCMEMVPEDTTELTVSPAERIVSVLRSNWGREKTHDLLILSPKFWAKKYPQR